MAFPQTPRQAKTELFLNGGWVDVTSDVYSRDKIQISRGSKDENTAPEPSSCQLTLNNRSGNYSPRNPNSIYYGSIGRNNPLRVTIEQLKDTFVRTVVNDWGSADTGQVWTPVSSGTFTASDFQVNGGVGKQSVPSAGNFRYNYTAANAWRDVDVAVTVTLPFTTVTGNSVFPANIILRWQSVDSYYLITTEVTTAGHVFIGIFLITAGPGSDVVASVDTGIIHSSSQALRVRAQTEGHTIRAKVWAAAGTEPYSWNVIGNDDSIGVAGPVGIRSEVFTGNTNTFPIVFSYSNTTVRVPRFVGEVSSWPQRWDTSGNDVYAPVEAAGIRRRMSQGVSPVKSEFTRTYSNGFTDVVAYWPVEDGKDSLIVASGIGGFPMTTQGKTDFAAYTELAASAPLATLDVGWWIGTIPNYTATGQTMFRWFMHAPSTALPDVSIIAQMFCTGTTLAWQITFRNALGDISIEAFGRNGTSVLNAGPFTFGAVDTAGLWSLNLTETGGNINWSLTTVNVGDTSGQNVSGTLNGFTVGKANRLTIDPYQGCKGTTLGHLAVRTAVTSIFDTVSTLNGSTGDAFSLGGETAGERIERLAAQEGIQLGGRGDRGNTAAAGAQRVDTLLNLLDSAADADLGVLAEMRGDSGLSFRTRASLYNQAATLSLDYSAGQITPPFEPTDDDQQTRNDVTVTRQDGSFAQADLVTGRMSILPPEQGGVGRYDVQTTLNVAFDTQLPDLATWLLAAGTVDETRYPAVTIDIANPNVTALDTAALTVDLGDRITIANPKTGQTPDTISQIVRGYTETIDLYEHTITYNCSPESPYQVVQLDTSGLNKLDSDDSTLSAGVTSSATTLSVAFTTVRWTTAAGDMPIPIRVGGEVMNVTAVSGTTSPQTFTVTRSVNGIVKAHSVGERVSLARRATLAL
jgi:hypothetical protein